VTDFAVCRFGLSVDVNNQARAERDITYVCSKLEDLDEAQIETAIAIESQSSWSDYHRPQHLRGV
jgi:hypothetical protein